MLGEGDDDDNREKSQRKSGDFGGKNTTHTGDNLLQVKNRNLELHLAAFIEGFLYILGCCCYELRHTHARTPT